MDVFIGETVNPEATQIFPPLQPLAELEELQLTLVGGGIGDTTR